MEDPDRFFNEGPAEADARRQGKRENSATSLHRAQGPYILLRSSKRRRRTNSISTPRRCAEHPGRPVRSFAHDVVPKLVDQGIAVLGMKPMAAGGVPENKFATGVECLHYALNLPHVGVHHGLQDQKTLDQAFEAARTFQALTPERDFGAAGQNPRGGGSPESTRCSKPPPGPRNRPQSPVDGVAPASLPRWGRRNMSATGVTQPFNQQTFEPRSISSSHPRAYPSARFTPLCRDGASLSARESNHSRAAVRMSVQVGDTRRRQPCRPTQPHLHGNRGVVVDLRDDELPRYWYGVVATQQQDRRRPAGAAKFATRSRTASRPEFLGRGPVVYSVPNQGLLR